MGDILISVIAKMAEYTVKPIGRQLGYLYYHHNNIRDLSEQVEMLKLTRESVRNRVLVAERNAEVMDDVVKNWFKEADGIINSCEMLIRLNEGQESNRYCSSRVCLNLVQRYQVSRKAKKMTVEVREIKTNGNFEKVAHEVSLLNGKLNESGFISFGSRESIIRQILDALMNDNVNMIGVYGMGGAGKTMLAKEIIRRVIENKSFDEVVMSTVSQTQDFKRIQGELGDMLGLKFEQETIQGRARKLHMRLKIAKNILIVLDDIWEDIDLDKLGIPSVADHRGCKILISSRDKNTLSRMSTDKTFEVKVLEQEESWNLFKKIAGEIVEQSDLKPTTLEIVKECAHLPIAIATIARALKSKPLPIWRDALYQLKNHKVMNIKGMNDKVYTSLELSYEHLDSREAKSVFLLCSMFPEDHRINVEDLHVYAMGMGLLMDIDTLAEGRDRTIKLVDDLISSSLLQKIEYRDGYVKMHDIVRDVAILIASKDDRIRTLSYVQGLNKWQEKKISGAHTAAYFHFGNSPNPPQKLMLPNIHLLMLTGPYGNKLELSGTFFEEKKELKVLELERVRISLSSPTLHSFANLRSLRLLDCELKDVDMSSIELNKLEILSFRGSDITEIPMVISQSMHLKVLDLSSCKNLKVIPPDLLSNLTNLEELFLGSFKGWEEESLNRERKNASLCELKHLSRLSALSINIPNEKILPKNMISSELILEKFDISIGHAFYFPQNTSKKLSLRMESESPLDDWIKILLKRVGELYLEGYIAEKFLRFEFDEIHFSHLKNLCLEDMKEVNHIIHESKKVIWKIFTNLEKIEITYCKMLEVVFVLDIEEATNKLELIRLKSLKLKQLPGLISFCSKIKQLHNSNSKEVGTLFKNQVSLPNLETLEIEDVKNFKMICDKVLIPGSSFAKLRILNISRCDNLEIVFPSNMISILNCLEHLSILSCNLLEGIFEVEEIFGNLLPRLSFFYFYRLPNLKYVWREDPQELQIFENVTFFIKECPKLKRVYPVKVVQQLEELDIGYGKLMETLEKVANSVKKVEMDETQSNKGEIIEVWDGEELLPKLKILKLWGSLNYKWTHFPIQMVRIFLNLIVLEVREIFVEEIFPNVKSHPLKKLALFNLPKLKHLWKESSEMNILLDFESLRLEECGRLNSLVPLSVSSLRNLRELIIHKCDGLIHLLNPQLASTLVRLQYMKLSGCKRMTSVISQRSTDDEEIVFTELTILELDDLSRLTTFHSGKCNIGFPCLKLVRINKCQEMKVFSLGTTTTPCLKTTRVFWSSSFIHEYFIPKASEEIIVEDINTIVREAWENIYNDYKIQHWYTGQVLLPDYLEILKFKFAYGFWKMICLNEIIGGSLAKIKRIEITHCNNLEKVFPSNVMSILECVEHIKIKSCGLLEGIFEDQECSKARKEKYGGLLPQLRSLELIDLPNLKYVWSEDPQELQNFENMKKLYIHRCPKFKRVYPQELKVLGIEYVEWIKCERAMEAAVKMAEFNISECSKVNELVDLWGDPDLSPKLMALEVSGSLLNY